MLIEKMKCPYGCQNSTLNESVKTITSPNNKLLLDSNQQAQQTMKVKVYTCNCCGKTFETPQGGCSNMLCS